MLFPKADNIGDLSRWGKKEVISAFIRQAAVTPGASKELYEKSMKNGRKKKNS